MLPNMGGVCIPPIILLLGCYFIQSVILPTYRKGRRLNRSPLPGCLGGAVTRALLCTFV